MTSVEDGACNVGAFVEGGKISVGAASGALIQLSCLNTGASSSVICLRLIALLTLATLPPESQSAARKERVHPRASAAKYGGARAPCVRAQRPTPANNISKLRSIRSLSQNGRRKLMNRTKRLLKGGLKPPLKITINLNPPPLGPPATDHSLLKMLLQYSVILYTIL